MNEPRCEHEVEFQRRKRLVYQEDRYTFVVTAVALMSGLYALLHGELVVVFMDLAGITLLFHMADRRHRRLANYGAEMAILHEPHELQVVGLDVTCTHHGPGCPVALAGAEYMRIINPN